MNDTDLERQVRAALYAIAPDLATEPLDPERRYRDQYEFDSMDFLRYVVELNRRTGVEIAESDYPKVETVAGAVAYLRERSGRTD
jgi:acyl carrier protein